MSTKVIVDPSSKMVYSSFYIKGLYDIYGKRNVSFSRKYFKSLKRKTELHSWDQYMAFVLIESGTVKKYIIDFRDKTSVKESAYDWCDKYGKINFNKERTDKRFHDKMVSIAPGYAVRTWNMLESAYLCIQNLILCRFSPVDTLYMHFADYYGQYTRAPLRTYLKDKNQDGSEPFVFLIGTLWPHKNCVEGTNRYRKAFIEAVNRTGIRFEGGFFVEEDNPEFDDYKHLIISKWYPNRKYIRKTMASDIVFNTPAVHDCHGWKLGEFLTMGKAIISMPLTHELPEKLVHGKNIHFVKDVAEIEEAVNVLIKDRDYRSKLMKEARAYHYRHVSPEKVIERVVGSE